MMLIIVVSSTSLQLEIHSEPTGLKSAELEANVGYVGFPGWETLSVSWAGKGAV